MSAIVWYFERSLALPFFAIGMKLTFSSAVATAEFSKFGAYWVQHFHSITFQDLKELNWNLITATSFVHSDAS